MFAILISLEPERVSPANFNFNFTDKGNIMALNKNTTTAKFESVEGDDVAAEETVQLSAKERLQAEAASRAAAQPASTSKEIAAAKPVGGQVAAARPMVDPLATLQNVFPVEFDTLCNVQLNQGNAINKDTGVTLGGEVGLELLSFQDQWVVSPGVDGDDAKEYVRYSDDGVTSTKGDNMAEYLEQLKASGFPKASMSKRMTIVGSLFDAGDKGNKINGMRDKLVQINLAPTSVAAFKRYRAEQAFKVGKGLAAIEGTERIRITCSIKKNGSNSYTVGDFTRYDEEAA